MNELDNKITTQFAGMVVRKDLVKTVKGNAIVPSYVLEYLLGQYCATSDEDSIASGIETVRKILREHYVHRNEANLVKSKIRERGRLKVIDKITVKLNDKRDAYEATFANLKISGVLIDADTVKSNQKLLVGGVWCLADLEYQPAGEANVVPWILENLKPIQISHFDYDLYLEIRQQFTTEEWMDLLMQSMGLNPAEFGWRNKMIQLTRLIPFCERNFNLIEMGPKGTGKSHIYSEFSPHGILISGGEVSVPKLFVNNATKEIGLVGYWDVVAFDEFTGKKRKDQALVDILKNYMANKSFSRGIDTIGAEASMAFVGNTRHNVPYMLKHADLFEPVPEQYHDAAFLDRLHFYIPGWEVEIIRDEMFSDGYGFVLDYLAEILHHMRVFDYTQAYTEHFELLPGLSTRDETSINKTFSGMMKVLFPGREAPKEEMKKILDFAIEGRKRVKDQLLRIDPTFDPVTFGYKEKSNDETHTIKTLEEKVHPQHYYRTAQESGGDETATEEDSAQSSKASSAEELPEEKHLTFEENQRGVSFDNLFGPYLKGASKIVIQDPFIRAFYQTRNLMELLETALTYKPEAEEISVHLITSEDDDREYSRQEEYLQQIRDSVSPAGIKFSWEYQDPSSIHARFLVLDSGWKILLDRGLDIFQRYEMNDAFTLSNRRQDQRTVKAFECTYIKLNDEEKRNYLHDEIFGTE
ncbi:MAG: BREX system Lon protease-like protein BrxL [Chloroflexota bacterium]|nr:MAG: BREX system Lon protease-like protein BrxL [Chloroflexota bacterium]